MINLEIKEMMNVNGGRAIIKPIYILPVVPVIYYTEGSEGENAVEM